MIVRHSSVVRLAKLKNGLLELVAVGKPPEFIEPQRIQLVEATEDERAELKKAGFSWAWVWSSEDLQEIS